MQLEHIVLGSVKEISSEEIVEFSGNDNAKFITLIPHSGLWIPTKCNEYLTADRTFLHNTFKNRMDYGTNLVFDMSDISYVIKTKICRCLLDVNRERNDRTKDGVIKTTDACGEPILTRPYGDVLYNRLLDVLYDPYYDKVCEAIGDVRKRVKDVLLFAGHSMESRDPFTNEKRPDICIGTLNGRSGRMDLISDFVEYIKGEFHGLHLGGEKPINADNIRVDEPFSGHKGLTQYFSNPNEGMHTILFEVRQNLLLDDLSDSLEYIEKKREKEEIYESNPDLWLKIKKKDYLPSPIIFRDDYARIINNKLKTVMEYIVNKYLVY